MDLKRIKTALAVFFILVISINKVNAALISQDYHTSGDGLITLDTTTGNEWLDVTVFAGDINTIDGMLNSANSYLQAGFTLATPSQVYHLARNAGLMYINSPYNSAFDYGLRTVSLQQQIAVHNLASLLGGETIPGTDFIYGLMDYAQNDDYYGLAILENTAMYQELTLYDHTAEKIGSPYPFPTLGAFMVRSSANNHLPNSSLSTIPEPSTLAMFAFVLLGLVTARKLI